MSQIFFLINYIAEINKFDIPEEFTLFTIDTSNCKLKTDIYIFKFYIIDNDFLSEKDREFLIDLFILCKMVKNSFYKITRNLKKGKLFNLKLPLIYILMN